MIMYNFNHERWMIVNAVIGFARVAVSDALMWAKQRKVFGQPLVDQPVIRFKLAEPIAAVEAAQSYLEAITFAMNT